MNWHDSFTFLPGDTGLTTSVNFIEFYINGQNGKYDNKIDIDDKKISELERKPFLLVSNFVGNFDFFDNFVVTIEENPAVLDKNKVKLHHDEVEQLKKWIRLNLEALKDLWQYNHEIDSGTYKDKGGYFTLLPRIKRWNGNEIDCGRSAINIILNTKFKKKNT